MSAENADWHMLDDPLIRRKLQNRINQRACRKRKARLRHENSEIVIKHWSGPRTSQKGTDVTKERPVSASCASGQESSNVGQDASGEGGKLIKSAVHSELESAMWHHLCKIGELDRFKGGTHLELSPYERRCWAQWSERRRAKGVLNDQLLSLIYFNLFRAMMSNVGILGLDLKQICDDLYPSPFLPMSPTSNSAITNLPVALRPTALQKEVYHHAYLDLFPCPVVRDNVLRRGVTEEEEADLCEDIAGYGADTNWFFSADEGPRTGATVWGDPWDIRNWEISEYLATKRKWMWVGCTVLNDATNARRRARGWKEIHFA